MQSFQHLRGKSWLAVDITTGRLGYVKDPAQRMGSAFFHDGKWHPISEKPSGIELGQIFIDECRESMCPV